MSYDDDEVIAPVAYDENKALQAYGAVIGKKIMAAVGAYQNKAPRTLQATMRQLGVSELGGCREFIRASVSGDKKDPPKEVNWPAYCGTAVGDFVEQAAKAELGADTQLEVTVTLPNSGIRVMGHTDIVDDDLVDLKTRDGLEEVMRDGPKFKECVQVSGYLVALIEEGRLPETACAILVYLDRSGRTSDTWTFTINLRQARNYLLAADDRLADIAQAITTGVSQAHLRDEPESWCFHVKCPFYTACWDGYQPDAHITDPQLIRAIQNYDYGRAQAKAGESLMRSAKALLNPHGDGNDAVEGWTPPIIEEEGKLIPLSIKWTLKDGYRAPSIDVRRQPTRAIRAPLPAASE